MNSIQLLMSFWAPYLFSFVVVEYGYQLAWLTGALYTIVFIFPIIVLRVSTGTLKESGLGPAD